MFKIALIGNMNNNLFALTRFLRDNRLDAHLFLLDNEMEHFLPEADTYDLSHLQFTHRLSFGNPYWFYNEVEKVRRFYYDEIKLLKTFDFIIACGSALGFLCYFRIGVDIFIPYGSDVLEYPFFVGSANPNHRIHLDAFCSYQKEAIIGTQHIITTRDFTNVACYNFWIDSLDCADKIQAFDYFPFIYDKIYTPNVIPNFFSASYWFRDFSRLREQNGMLIFAHCRQAWKSVDAQTQKGNDKLLEAYACVVKKFRKYNPCLVLFDYGPDVGYSKNKIKDLGVEDFVTWLPKMYRKDIMVGLYFADIACDTFSIGYTMGGVIAEVLIAHKPLISYVDCAKFVGNPLYFHLNAYDKHEIVEQIEEGFLNREKFIEAFKGNYAWICQSRDMVIDYIKNAIYKKGSKRD